MNKNHKNKNKIKMPFEKTKFFKGFTIFELLIVFVVIAIIFSFVFVEIQPARARTRDARRISDLNNLKASLQLFYMEKGTYPETPEDGEWCSLSEPEEEECEGFVYEFAQSLASYVDGIPKDPLHAKEEDGKVYSYRYYALSSGQEYKIHAYLETGEDYEVYSSRGLVIRYTEEEEPGTPGPGTPPGQPEQYPPAVVTFRSEEARSSDEEVSPSDTWILKGEVVGFGSTGVIIGRGFEWRTEGQGYDDERRAEGENSWTESGHFELGLFEYSLTLPAPEPGVCMLYYYRAKARDPNAGWGYGDEQNIGSVCHTPPEPPPATRH